MERVHNFNAGPAVLPEEVLREAQADLGQILLITKGWDFPLWK